MLEKIVQKIRASSNSPCKTCRNAKDHRECPLPQPLTEWLSQRLIFMQTVSIGQSKNPHPTLSILSAIVGKTYIPNAVLRACCNFYLLMYFSMIL